MHHEETEINPSELLTACLMRRTLPKLVGTRANEPDNLSDEANHAETRWHPRQRARQPV